MKLRNTILPGVMRTAKECRRRLLRMQLQVGADRARHPIQQALRTRSALLRVAWLRLQCRCHAAPARLQEVPFVEAPPCKAVSPPLSSRLQGAEDASRMVQRDAKVRRFARCRRRGVADCARRIARHIARLPRSGRHAARLRHRPQKGGSHYGDWIKKRRARGALHTREMIYY